MATPPPHPSEAPPVNLNPLATTPQPATAGSKLSLLNLDDRSTPPALSKMLTAMSATSLQESGAGQAGMPEKSRESESSTDAGMSTDGGATSSELASSAPAFGQGNTLLTQAPTKDANKRRKPKNNITKSNSSFISRVIIHENLSKRLAERPSDGMFAFANINRAFQWLDLSSPSKVCDRLGHSSSLSETILRNS